MERGIFRTVNQENCEIKKAENLILGVESRNNERVFNCALEFIDKMFFQGPFIF